jgi:hypothetical protein
LLLMNGDRPPLWTDRSCLQQVQYRTDANLAIRQSLYAYQHPRIDLPAAVLNGPGHLRELRDLIAATLRITASDPPLGQRLRLDDGQNLLASQFASVIRHDFTSEGPFRIHTHTGCLICT